MQIMTLITKYWEKVAQLLILLGVITTLYLNSKYVTIERHDRDIETTRTEFVATTKEMRNERIVMIDKLASELNTFAKDNAAQHIAIQASIVDISTALKIMAANQKQIEDHESRIRELERNKRNNEQ